MNHTLQDAEEYEARAYAQNARHELATLRSDIIGALTGPNDLYLKTSLIQGVDAVDKNLKKAMA